VNRSLQTDAIVASFEVTEGGCAYVAAESGACLGCGDSSGADASRAGTSAVGAVIAAGAIAVWLTRTVAVDVVCISCSRVATGS